MSVRVCVCPPPKSGQRLIAKLQPNQPEILQSWIQNAPTSSRNFFQPFLSHPMKFHEISKIIKNH